MDSDLVDLYPWRPDEEGTKSLDPWTKKDKKDFESRKNDLGKYYCYNLMGKHSSFDDSDEKELSPMQGPATGMQRLAIHVPGHQQEETRDDGLRKRGSSQPSAGPHKKTRPSKEALDAIWSFVSLCTTLDHQATSAKRKAFSKASSIKEAKAQIRTLTTEREQLKGEVLAARAKLEETAAAHAAQMEGQQSTAISKSEMDRYIIAGSDIGCTIEMQGLQALPGYALRSPSRGPRDVSALSNHHLTQGDLQHPRGTLRRLQDAKGILTPSSTPAGLDEEVPTEKEPKTPLGRGNSEGQSGDGTSTDSNASDGDKVNNA
ncbi:OLC1v1024603C1 [Oldenlandia corymbosa var. corymbosa]|uniref:OLC1v1024603C1 n=1 Tax=Oldenlandia corymbosa var. corymbosa TaxID=529605 RepID=A0AAV1C3J5_OLDCO|nr:OLC1v1024603C1 [Oldenlandia corymbosa var. corymbosa]